MEQQNEDSQTDEDNGDQGISLADAFMKRKANMVKKY